MAATHRIDRRQVARPASGLPPERRNFLIEPCLGGGAPAKPKPLEKVPANVSRALGAEPLEMVVR
jgi:hypothetical protein